MLEKHKRNWVPEIELTSSKYKYKDNVKRNEISILLAQAMTITTQF